MRLAYAEQGLAAFIATLNQKDFPQKKLRARVISPGEPIPTMRRRDRVRNPLNTLQSVVDVAAFLLERFCLAY
jgi:hypothetical protein